MKRSSYQIIITTVLFAALVVAYFSCPALGFDGQLMRDLVKTSPVLFLCLATLIGRWRSRGVLPLALLFSACGDLAGEHKEFILQIAMFAIAHIAYFAHFIRRATIDRTSIVLWSILGAMVIALGVIVIGHISKPTEAVACSIYIVIIATMAGSAIACRSPYRVWNIAAALLFIFSDSCIAINRFVEHIPHAGLLIMTTYFTAQYIFATVYLKEHSTQNIQN